MTRDEIGYCVCELFRRRWRWTTDGSSLYLWLDHHHAAHVEAYWRHRLKLALE